MDQEVHHNCTSTTYCNFFSNKVSFSFSCAIFECIEESECDKIARQKCCVIFWCDMSRHLRLVPRHPQINPITQRIRTNLIDWGNLSLTKYSAVSSRQIHGHPNLDQSPWQRLFCCGQDKSSQIIVWDQLKKKKKKQQQQNKTKQNKKNFRHVSAYF